MIMKTPFVTKAQVDEMIKKYPTPFHLYDEKESEKMQESYIRHFHGIRDLRSSLR